MKHPIAVAAACGALAVAAGAIARPFHGTAAAVIGDALYLPAGAPATGGSGQSDTLFVYEQF